MSNRFKADEEKKLLILFDAIRSEKYVEDDTELVIDLYKENNAKTRNRYYRLRNKLLDNIEKSLVFYHFKYKDSIHAYYDIQLSIMFRERGNYHLANYFLKKAEKKAAELDQFNILEQIYEEYMRLAVKDIELDIDAILKRRKSNLEKVKIQRRNTEAIALLTQKLKKSNFSRRNASVVDLLSKVKKQVERSEEIFQSPEGKLQIFRTVSALLLQKEAYGQLVTYLRDTIAEFEAQKLFNNDNHSERLMMRIWLTLSLYKTYQFQDALEELDTLEKEMKMYSRQNYATYLFNFYNVKVNILMCLGQLEEAGDLARKATKLKEINSNKFHHAYMLRTLADHEFSRGMFMEAAATLTRIKSLSNWEKLDLEVRMYIEIFSMVNHFEAENYSYINDVQKDFKKSYKKLLKDDSGLRTKRFLDILFRMNKAAIEDKRVSLKSALSGFNEMFGDSEHGDNSIILYDLYLKSKVEDRPYYDLFVEQMASKAK